VNVTAWRSRTNKMFVLFAFFLQLKKRMLKTE